MIMRWISQEERRNAYKPSGRGTPMRVMAALRRAVTGGRFCRTAWPTAIRCPSAARSSTEKDTAVIRGVLGGRPGRLVGRKETIMHPVMEGHFFLYYNYDKLSI